jgi:tetratricopeptide (TPR) repeat protein
MRALDPATNEYLFTLKADGKGKASIPGMIDRLSAQTRERLRERPADLAAGRGVADVTTANLAAYEHYFKARQAMDLQHPDAAIVELDAALKLDPRFALAQYQRAVVDAWTPLWTKASGAADEASRRTMQEHLASALKLADRLPEKERLALLGWQATLDRRSEDALRLRDQAAEAYPQDKEAVLWAGDVRFHEGKFEESIPYFERALKLDPKYVLPLDHLARAYEFLGMPEQQLEASRKWIEASQAPDAYRSAGRALLSFDRREETELAFRRAFEIDGRLWPSPAIGYWLMYQGRPHDAEALAREGLKAIDARPSPVPDPHGEPYAEEGLYVRLLVSALGEQGRLRDAQAVVDGLLEADAPETEVAKIRFGFATGARSLPQVRQAVADAERLGLLKSAKALVSASVSLLVVGQPAAAATLLERARAAPDWAEVEPSQLQLQEALSAWRAGRLDEAEAGLRAFAEGAGVGRQYTGQNVLGEFLIGRGKDAEAVAALEKARGMRWSGAAEGRPWFDPSSLFLLAGAYERLGEKQKARERVDELLKLWQRADPDLPRLAEARAMKKRLAPRTAQATQR